jgi:hypothetical protein
MLRTSSLLALTLLVAAGCARTESLVVVDLSIDGDATLDGIVKLSGSATAGGRTVPFAITPTQGAASFAVPPAQSFGIALPRDFAGAIHVQVDALGSDAQTLASGSADGTIKPGAVSRLSLTLVRAVAPPPDAPDMSESPPDLAPAAAQLTIDHAARMVGDVLLGQSSTAARFVITNTGEQPSDPLTLTTGGNTVEFKVTTDCAGALAPKASCNVTAILTPTSPGDKAADFTIADDLGASVAGSVSGHALQPGSLGITPDKGDCGAALLGVASTTIAKFTVKNGGQAATGKPMVSTSDPQFVASGCPDALPAGAQCTVSVQFTPASPGGFGTQTASVKVIADPGGPAVAGLTGVGLRPATLSAPASVSFSGTTPRGGNGPTQMITVTNQGDVASATLSASTLSGSGFAIVTGGDGCGGAALMPMKSCQVAVQFRPQATGAASGTLKINAGAKVLASTALAGTATPAWTQEAGSLQLGQMNGVWGLDADHVWAVGLGGSIAFRDASGTWTLQTAQFMHPPDVYSVWGASATDLYAGSDHGLLHSFGGGNDWTNASGSNAPTSFNVTGVWGFASRDLYAAVGTTIFYPDPRSGGGWLTNGAGNGTDRVWGSSGTDLYAFGVGDGKLRIYRGAGSWTTVYDNAAASGNTITAVWGFGAPATSVYATQAFGAPLHSNGGGAGFGNMTNPTPVNCNAVWGASASAVLFACQGGVYTWNGTSWSAAALVGPSIRWLWGSSASNVYAVGLDASGKGAVYHYY